MCARERGKGSAIENRLFPLKDEALEEDLKHGGCEETGCIRSIPAGNSRHTQIRVIQSGVHEGATYKGVSGAERQTAHPGGWVPFLG